VLLGWGWVDGESATGFGVAGAGCFGAGFEVCVVGVVAALVPTGPPAGFDAGALGAFATPGTGAAVDFTWPGISDDAVSG
jgi:hypothetical protein